MGQPNGNKNTQIRTGSGSGTYTHIVMLPASNYPLLINMRLCLRTQLLKNQQQFILIDTTGLRDRHAFGRTLCAPAI